MIIEAECGCVIVSGGPRYAPLRIDRVCADAKMFEILRAWPGFKNHFDMIVDHVKADLVEEYRIVEQARHAKRSGQRHIKKRD